MIEKLKQMKDALVNCASVQINGHLDQVDTKELGEAIDMIKDLAEAVYYCAITKAMEEQDKHEKQEKLTYNYYTEYRYPRSPEEPMYYRNGNRYYDQMNGAMYYNGQNGRSGGGNGSSAHYQDFPYERMMQDPNMGRSPEKRKAYMEGKQNHQDKTKQIQELEKYMQELSQDITEMIMDASPEEKTMLQQKLNVLATKVK